MEHILESLIPNPFTIADLKLGVVVIKDAFNIFGAGIMIFIRCKIICNILL
ncbi:hypothetical protein SDC9_195555 [bioreactor metagenome]|uniref:Uncharacterized protein n=1 Tax=bioreactor metagenome TaxID=1076179 RepID=A0A645I9E3_9ZZZZ